MQLVLSDSVGLPVHTGRPLRAMANTGGHCSADFLWIIKQMRGWYVAAPMGSQCDPLAGKLAVDSLA